MEREASLAPPTDSREENAANRVAMLTPPGAAAIAVIRISGPSVPIFLEKHFSKRVKDGRCVHGVLSAGGTEIDDPVIVATSDGRFADINLHGGEWVVRACLELTRQNGFELVEHLPDESLRTLQQEIISALPMARTEPAIRMLLAQEQLWGGIQPDTNAIRAILGDKTLWWMLHPPKIAIVGAANVGKSTLANQLFGQERSITADVPGTTRDWVGDWTNIDGLPILLIDTPGLRESDDPIEQAAIGHSSRQISEADLLIGVLDPTRPLEPQQQAMPDRGQNRLVVINKSDLPAVWDLRVVDAVFTIATSGEGIDKLRQRIRDCFISDVSELTPRWWTSRQRSILKRALLDPVALAKLV